MRAIFLAKSRYLVRKDKTAGQTLLAPPGSGRYNNREL